MTGMHISYVRTETNPAVAQIFRVFVADTLLGPQGARAILDVYISTVATVNPAPNRMILIGKVGEDNPDAWIPTKGRVTLREDDPGVHPVSRRQIASYLRPADRLAGLMGRVYNPTGPVWTPEAGEHTPATNLDWDMFLADQVKAAEAAADQAAYTDKADEDESTD